MDGLDERAGPVTGDRRAVPTWYRVLAPVLAGGLFLWYFAGVVRLDLTGGLGFTLDDGWIHLVFARNLVQFHTWGFNPGQASAGDTSILWVLLLAGGFFFTRHGPWISYGLSFMTLLIVSALLGRLVVDFFPSDRPGGRNRFWRIAVLVIVVCCGNVIWYAFSGMETLLLLALGLGAICSAASDRRGLTAILTALAALTRPEGIIVALVIAVWDCGRGRGGWRPYRPLPLWVYGLTGAAWGFMQNYGLQHHVSGRFLPATLLGRSWIIGWPAGPTVDPLSILKNFSWLIGVWGYRLLQFTFGQALLRELGLPEEAAWVVAGLVGLLAAVGFIVYLARMRGVAVMFLLWSIGQVLAYAVILPTRGHAGRYQPMVVILAALCFGLGVYVLGDAAIRGVRRQAIKVLAGAVLAAAVAIVIGSVWLWRAVVIQSIAHFDAVHVRAACFLREHTDPQARIAAFDIGAMGYFAGREVIDVSGLLDPRAGHALYDGTMVNYLVEKRPDYLAMIFPYTDPPSYFNAMHLDKLATGEQLKEVKTFSIPIPQPYWPGEAARVLAGTIRIYRVDWAW